MLGGTLRNYVPKMQKDLSMKKIPLTRGLVTLVDEEDYAALSAYRWQAWSDRRGHIYATRTAQKNKRRTFLSMGRVIMSPPPGLQVDHINGDTLDNRRINLRVCTKGENRRNSKGCGASGFKGVTRPGRTPKAWLAQIQAADRVIRLGRFVTKEEAARAYDSAAKRYFGEFAWLNFPAEMD